jgi:hypothetical protein
MQWHEKSPRPPHSPELTPCDFYLFGYIIGRLAGASFEEPDQLLHGIDVIFQSAEKATLKRVFHEWMDRLAQFYVAVGDFVEATSEKSEDDLSFTRPVSRC